MPNGSFAWWRVGTRIPFTVPSFFFQKAGEIRWRDLIYEAIARVSALCFRHEVTIHVDGRNVVRRYEEITAWFGENGIRWRMPRAGSGHEAVSSFIENGTVPITYRFLRVRDAIYFKLRWYG